MIYSIAVTKAPLYVGPPTVYDCETWDIEVTQRSQHNQATGSVTLVIRRTPDQEPLIGASDQVTILRDGVTWWQGVAKAPVDSWTESDYAHLHVIDDPWQIICETPWRFQGTLPTHAALSSSAWSLLVDFTTELLSTWFTMPEWGPTIPNHAYPAWPNINGKMNFSIMALLKPNEQAAVAFDHTQTPPLMRVTNGGDVVRTLHTVNDGVTDIHLSRRDDLMPLAVQLLSSDTGTAYYLSQMQTSWPLFFKTGDDTFYPATAVRDGWRCATLINPALYFAEVVEGAAAYLFKMLGVAFWEGSIVIYDGVCATGIMPGDTINLIGPRTRPSHATMGAIVQSVTEDPMRGETTLRLGPNGAVTPTDVIMRIQDLLGGRPWATYWTTSPFQLAMLPGSYLPSAVTLAGAGTSAICPLTDIFDDGVGMSGQLILTTGATGITGDGSGNWDLCQVVFPTAVGGTVTSVVLTPVNAAAIALSASVSASGDRYQFTVLSTSAPAPATLYVFNYMVNITPP